MLPVRVRREGADRGGGRVNDMTALAEHVGVLDNEQEERDVSEVWWAVLTVVMVIVSHILVGLMEGGY